MAESEEAAPEEEGKKKGGAVKIILLVVVVLVLVGGAGVGGVMYAKSAVAAPAEEPAEPSPEDQPRLMARFSPIVVDVRNDEGKVHHLKVGLAAEYPETVTEDEFKKFQPRGREAAIAYLRAQTFERLTASKHFDDVRTELEAKITEAIGEKRVLRILVTDFVAQ